MLYFYSIAQKTVVVYPASERTYFQSLTYTDSLTFDKKIKSILAEKQNKGFLEYSIDSLFIKQDTLFLHIWIGKKYIFLPLQYNSEEIKNPPNYIKPISNPKQIQAITEKIIALYMQKGYPFVKCKVDYQITSQKENYIYQPTIRIDKGSKYFFDSISFIGISSNASKLARKIIDIQSKDVFNQKKVDNVVRLLQNSPYFEQCKIKEMRFTTQNTVHLFIDAQTKKANYIDGVLGIAPANAQQDKTQITGNLKLNIVNPNWGGKTLYIQWDRLPATSQNLEIKFKQPYLFQSPLDVQAQLSIQKQDSTFLRRDLQSKINYQINGFWSLEGGLFNRQSYSTLRNSFRRDTLSTPIIPKTQNLIFNFSQTLYAIGIKYFSLDNLYAPQRGADILIETYTGYKNIRKTQGIDTEIFENLNVRTLVYALQAKYAQYWRFNSRQVGVVGINAAILTNPYLTLNDLHRLGGLRTIRGFNELSYFASNYSVATFEYRYFLEAVSFLSLFLDYGWLQERYQMAMLKSREIVVNNQIRYQTYQSIEERSRWYNPIGFGVGMQLLLEKAGILSLAIALGRDTQLPNTTFNVRQIKLHFGLLTRF
ncbi:MAG: BamA/TamA family outer membrane protein [Bacteroidia bacterium]|nr:BamA/TamA family outer membrane protein [Bacteroidia bacterium]